MTFTHSFELLRIEILLLIFKFVELHSSARIPLFDITRENFSLNDSLLISFNFRMKLSDMI